MKMSYAITRVSLIKRINGMATGYFNALTGSNIMEAEQLVILRGKGR